MEAASNLTPSKSTCPPLLSSSSFKSRCAWVGWAPHDLAQAFGAVLSCWVGLVEQQRSRLLMDGKGDDPLAHHPSNYDAEVVPVGDAALKPISDLASCHLLHPLSSSRERKWQNLLPPLQRTHTHNPNEPPQAGTSGERCSSPPSSSALSSNSFSGEGTCSTPTRPSRPTTPSLLNPTTAILSFTTLDRSQSRSPSSLLSSNRARSKTHPASKLQLKPL